jgi:hypothetical protein
LIRKGKLPDVDGNETNNMHNIPDGIIAHLARESGGDMYNRKVVDVSWELFGNEIEEANPHSGAYESNPLFAAQNAADLESNSFFYSAHDVIASCIGENTLPLGHIHLRPHIAKAVSNLYSCQPSDRTELSSGSHRR